MDAPVLEFVAIGPEPGQRWRRRLHRGRWFRLGRAPGNGWAVPWDMRVSREHADLILEGERLRVRCLESARNSPLLLGLPNRDFSILDGENFRIGGTLFCLEKVAPPDSDGSKDEPADAPESRPGVDSNARAAADAEILTRRKQEQRSLNDSRKSAVVALRAEVKALTALMHSLATAERKSAELQALQSDVDSLNSQMKAEAAAHRRAAHDARRTVENAEIQRKVEDQARRDAEAAQSRAQVENETLQRAEENARLQIEQAETRLGSDKLASLQTEEAVALRSEVEQLKARLAAQVSDQRKIEEDARHRAGLEAERQEIVEELRKAEQDARQRAEEAELLQAEFKVKSAEQAKELQAEVEALKAKMESNAEAQRKAHDAAQKAKDELRGKVEDEGRRQAAARSGDFDPYYRWLGIRPDEQPADYYRLLGLARFENDLDVIEGAADRQMAHVRRHQTGKHGRLSQTLLNELSAAKLTLFNADKKRQYDEMLGERVVLENSGSRSTDSDSDESGTLLGEYRIVDIVDRGGSGQVFKAEHQTMGRVVALKILSEDESNSPNQTARFQRKVRVLARLNHPNLVTAFDAGSRNGQHYLIMEYVDGVNLVSLVKREKSLSYQAVVEYVVQAAAGLGYAHSHQIIHRNVKPSHILVDDRGTVKVIGLGLALFQGDASLNAASDLQEARVIGSADYIAPEQTVDSSKVDARADIYGLGCTMYTVLTRSLMFPVESARDKLLAHRHEAAPALKQLRPDVPENLEQVYGKMVAKSPEDRFQSMDQVIEALRAIRF